MEITLKERITQTASGLFFRNGIKSVTMDDIAKELGISKRTLYENFKDKNELLINCIMNLHDKKVKSDKEIIKNAENAMAVLLICYKDSLESFKVTNRNFFRDLRKYHPKAAKCFEADRDDHKKRSNMLLLQGVKEGYIRKDLNLEIVSILLAAQFEKFFTSNDLDTDKFSFEEVFQTIMMNFMRGIATQKGITYIEDFIEKNNIK